MEKVITDNTSETIIAKWDGTRFAIVVQHKSPDYPLAPSYSTILNPREMMSLIDFAGKLGKDDLQNVAKGLRGGL